MPFYQNSDQLCEVMNDLFHRTMADPGAVRELRNSGMVLRLNISEPAAMITVNGRAQPPHFNCGTSSERADLVMNTRMDVIHRVWLGETKLSEAFFGGHIKVQGSMLRAMTLGGLFRRIEALYPGVLRDRGLLAA